MVDYCDRSDLDPEESGKSTNCGHNFIKHHHSQKDSPYFKEYKTWSSMKSACYSPKNKCYKNTGAKNILVCDRWKDSFENFLEDMGPRGEGLILRRKNPLGIIPLKIVFGGKGRINIQ